MFSVTIIKDREIHLKVHGSEKKEKFQGWLSHQLSKVVKWPSSFKCSDLTSLVFTSSFVKQQSHSSHPDIMSNKE